MREWRLSMYQHIVFHAIHEMLLAFGDVVADIVNGPNSCILAEKLLDTLAQEMLDSLPVGPSEVRSRTHRL
jgi:hypothetical protein